MSDFVVRKVTLPGGKKIEIVYFNAEPVANSEQWPRCRRLEQCQTPSCHSFLVNSENIYIENDEWKIDLCCPECGRFETGAFSVEEQDHFEEFQNKTATLLDKVATYLEAWNRNGYNDELIADFAGALESEAISPSDFKSK